MIITGDTGSGKTTQVAQYILEEAATAGGNISETALNIILKGTSGHNFPSGQSVRVAVTEPRRLAAVTVAERVATERGEKVGGSIVVELLLSISFSRWEEQ